jgi:hypothetical protein
MFDHYKVVSKETPGHAYDITKSYNFIQNRSQSALFYPRDRPKQGNIKGSRGGSSCHIIAKSKDPAPGCYPKAEEAAIKYTQERRGKLTEFSKKAKVMFIDMVIKDKKNVPGVGAYLNREKSFESLSRPLSSLARKR